MQTYEIIVAGRAVRANSADTTLVRTSVGIDKIHVLFDNAEWTGFPVRVTFANGETLVSTSVTLNTLESTEWAAEAECTVPWEVIQALGGIRITFQGTDSGGKHIITEASGTPLTVVEAGDVVDGSEPQPDPTVDEWHQAYADAMAAASDAASAAEQVAEILHSTDAQTLEELLAALGSALRFKGSVNAYVALPATPEQGDVYNVAGAYGDYPAGTNWAWTGTAWDALGGEVDLSAFATKDSPAFAGTPTAPTAASGTDTTQIATTAFVQQEIDANAYELPTMDATTKGGATLGQGLTVSDGALSLGPLVESGSGEGVDTQGCALFGVSARGWAQQASTTGKNLLPNTATSQTINGVTFTVNPDGSVTANGTASATTVIAISSALSLASGSTYALGGCPSGGSSTTYSLMLRNSSISGNILATDTGSGAAYVHSSENAPVPCIRIQNGVTVHNLTFYPQLESGSTATSYEPYSGAKPSPSPEYAQEIRVCRGRNLLDTSAFTAGKTMSDAGVVSDGSATQTISPEIPVDGGESYAFSVTVGSTGYKRIAAYDANGVFLALLMKMTDTATVGAYKTATFTTPANAACVRVSCNTPDLSTVQLELGSTPTPYVPYGHVGLEVESPNLYGFSDKSSVTSNGITWTGQPDGRYWAKGTATANSFGLPGNPSMADFGKSFIAKLEAGTYTATSYGEVPFNVYSMPLDSASGTALRSYLIDDFTFTLEEPRYIQLGPRISSGTVVDRAYSFAIFRGNSAMDYVPKSHTTTPIPLPLKSDGERWAGGLPDGTADALSVDSAGRYEWTCPSYEVVLDGSETWRDGASGKRKSVSFAVNAKPPKNNQSTANAICSHFQQSTGDETYVDTVGMAINSTGVEMYFNKLGTEAMTVADWTAWLQANPVTVLYQLATPTTEHGYIDLPDLPSGARVSIPELEGFACSWWVEGAEAVVEHASNERKRIEELIADIQEAIADL